MNTAKYLIGLALLSIVLPLNPGYSRGNIDDLLNKIRANSTHIKNSFHGGEFEYLVKEGGGIHKTSEYRYYLAFNKDNFYTKALNNSGSYSVKNKDKYFTVSLEKEDKYSKKTVKLVTVSRRYMPNNILARGLLINKNYVCDALSTLSNPQVGKDPKWGEYLQLESTSEFKGDKIHDIYKISKDGVVFQQEEEIRRGSELYIVRDKVLDIRKIDRVIVPMATSMEKVKVENGVERQTRRSDFKVLGFKLGAVDERLFEVKEEPGDRFKDGNSWDYWKVGPKGERIYIDISGGVLARKRMIGSIFVVSLSLTLVLLATWWVRRRLTLSM